MKFAANSHLLIRAKDANLSGELGPGPNSPWTTGCMNNGSSVPIELITQQ